MKWLEIWAFFEVIGMIIPILFILIYFIIVLISNKK